MALYVSRSLKEQCSNVQIMGVYPVDGSQIPAIRRWPEAYPLKIFGRERADGISTFLKVPPL